ncbi:hypothetical protein ACQKNC_00075 [Lysinibacillus sp. NPDC094177]|uniref:hypothetical protein n=1 Tax=Lysinibacillus sp. NPDC094177 TaxID=3390580 RepID=UPI003CFDEDB9
MKNLLTKVIASLLVFSLVISAFSPTTLAKNKKANTEVDEQQVQELAEALEFVFEQAIVMNEFGQAVGLDFDKIEGKYGISPDLEKAIDENEVVTKTRTAAVDRCLSNKIKNYFTAEDFLPTAVINSVIALILEKNYTSAALKIIKAGEMTLSILHQYAQISIPII